MKLIKGMPTRQLAQSRVAEQLGKRPKDGLREPNDQRTKGPTRTSSRNQTELPALTCHNALGHTLATLALTWPPPLNKIISSRLIQLPL